MTVTKSNHFPGYLVSDEGMLTLSASSHHNQSKESSREQGLTSKELREKQKYKTLFYHLVFFFTEKSVNKPPESVKLKININFDANDISVDCIATGGNPAPTGIIYYK